MVLLYGLVPHTITNNPIIVILSIIRLYITWGAWIFKRVSSSFITTEYFICPSARWACRPAEWKKSVKLCKDQCLNGPFLGSIFDGDPDVNLTNLDANLKNQLHPGT